MTRQFILLFLIGIMCTELRGQAQRTDPGHFLVEEEKFTPPESAIIDHYRASAPMPFMANDMEQVERYLGDYTGKLVFLWFWKIDCPLCLAEIDGLNKLVNEFPDAFSFLSLADDDRNKLTDFLTSMPVTFPVIPNAGILAEGAYAHDLGYPRLFVIGKDGLVRTILPASYFEGEHDLYSLLRSILEKEK